MNELIPPAIPPIPVMVAIADLGNMSPMVEKRLADHAWCPAPARPMIIAGHHAENCPIGCAKSAKRGKNAKMSMASIRPL